MNSDKRRFLTAYSHIIQEIRQFFKSHNVVEVFTPTLGESTIPDPAIESFSFPISAKPYFLQTSPEFYMKRLLAEGSGCIYQISKVFRREELGRLHQPEFTMLEWYRVGFDDFQLIDEVDQLLQLVLKTKPAVRFTYNQLFKKFLDIDLNEITDRDLINQAKQSTNAMVNDSWSKDELLDLLLCERIEPELAQIDTPVCVHDFPVSKAALSKIVRRSGQEVAARFEFYYRGIELANGFYELTDPEEQRARFIKDNQFRLNNRQNTIPLDEKFLKSLTGLPECSGVALGLDRLIMLAMNKDDIQDVINFPITQH